MYLIRVGRLAGLEHVAKLLAVRVLCHEAEKAVWRVGRAHGDLSAPILPVKHRDAMVRTRLRACAMATRELAWSMTLSPSRLTISAAGLPCATNFCEDAVSTWQLPVV